jgi:uncharacterized membrane protein YhaH (DUF805 family)
LESAFLAVVHYEQSRKQRVEMNYLKSALVGVGAVFLIFVFVPLLAILVRILTVAVKHSGEIGISFGLRWGGQSPVYWLAVIAVFAIAYLWELRRLTK